MTFLGKTEICTCNTGCEVALTGTHAQMEPGYGITQPSLHLLAEYLLHVPVVHFVILDSLGQLERTADPDGRGGEVVVHHRRLLREHVEGLGGNSIGLNLLPKRYPKYALKVDRIKSVYHRYLFQDHGAPK